MYVSKCFFTAVLKASLVCKFCVLGGNLSQSITPLLYGAFKYIFECALLTGKTNFPSDLVCLILIIDWYTYGRILHQGAFFSTIVLR